MKSVSKFVIEKGVLKSYNGNCADVVIPDGVTDISSITFMGNDNITNITIPDSVKSIGAAAFFNCRKLLSVEIPGSVQFIGSSAFGRCSALETVVFHNGIRSIGAGAFPEDSIKNMILPEYNKGEFKDSSLEVVWKYFSKTADKMLLMKSFLVQVPELVSDNADFKRAVKSKKDKIMEYAISNNDAEIVECLFSLYKNTISIDSLDKYISHANEATAVKAFLLNYKEKNYSPEQQDAYEVDKIEKELGLRERTYSEWKKIFSFRVDDTGVTITGYRGNSTVVDIPGYIGEHRVVSVGKSAFNPDVIRSKLDEESARKNVTVIKIPDSVTSIGYGAFKNCENLDTVIIPESVKSIGRDAFYNCKSLKSVEIPRNVKTISYNMFYGCEKLSSVKLHDKVKSIGNGAFSGCVELSELKIPDSVKTIGKDVFYKCTKLNIETSAGSVADEYNKARCPLCGGEMCLRKSVYGEFFGCSHFPVCKGTRKYINQKNK